MIIHEPWCSAFYGMQRQVQEVAGAIREPQWSRRCSSSHLIHRLPFPSIQTRELAGLPAFHGLASSAWRTSCLKRLRTVAVRTTALQLGDWRASGGRGVDTKSLGFAE